MSKRYSISSKNDKKSKEKKVLYIKSGEKGKEDKEIGTLVDGFYRTERRKRRVNYVQPFSVVGN